MPLHLVNSLAWRLPVVLRVTTSVSSSAHMGPFSCSWMLLRWALWVCLLRRSPMVFLIQLGWSLISLIMRCS